MAWRECGSWKMIPPSIYYSQGAHPDAVRLQSGAQYRGVNGQNSMNVHSLPIASARGSPVDAARILIVEDERLIAVDLQRRLTRLGYTVVGIVASGSQAIALAYQLRPNLVLMDIH